MNRKAPRTDARPKHLTSTTNARADWYVIAFFLLFVPLTSLGYTLYTGHVWEDFFITYRHSQNFANGNGLVFQPGERVHGFTSPINVMLPAIFAALTGSSSYVLPLWMYRLASIAALTTGGFLMCRLLVSFAWIPRFNLYLFAMLFGFEIKTIAFTINGQEAGFMILFLLAAIVAAFQGVSTRWLTAGLCWAGLMYTRPDSFVYIAALGCASLLFAPKQERADTLKGCSKAALLCAAIYLPWFIAMWSYYGNPIPHTVLAKSAASAQLTGQEAVEGIARNILLCSGVAFQPIYSDYGGWPSWVFFVSLACGLFCLAYCFLPQSHRLGRICSFVFVFVTVYFSYISAKSFLFPWYLPPVSICGIVILLIGPNHLVLKQHPHLWKYLAAVLNLICVVAFAVIFLLQSEQIRVQQRVVENGNRRLIGIWLSENVGSDETVFVECLGYIGFFSDARMLDFPGLASPLVRETLLEHGATMTTDRFTESIPYLEPDWLVLRPDSAELAAMVPGVKGHYRLVKVFSVVEQVEQFAHLSGRPYLENDAVFLIFRRERTRTHG